MMAAKAVEDDRSLFTDVTDFHGFFKDKQNPWKSVIYV
jgi:hypothetical protein